MAPLTDLYNPLLGGLPGSQGRLIYAATAPSGASLAAVPGGLRLRSDRNGAAPTAVRAGLSTHLPILPLPLRQGPVLERSQAFALRFEMALLAENHGSNPHRAGFSVTLIGADRRGIELGFWLDAVFAQKGGAAAGLFTRGEEARLSGTTARRTYELLVVGDRYLLSVSDPSREGATASVVLSGAIRDYGSFNAAAAGLPYNPYTTPNFVFLGDNTASASADVELGGIALLTPRLGGSGADRLQSALATGEILNGLAGDDILIGAAGADVLIGDAGQDLLQGGAGDDRLIGGSGPDRFLFDSDAPFRAAALGLDTIVDFTPGLDRIVLDRTTFTRLRSAPGSGLTVAADFARVSSDQQAQASNACLVYDCVNGILAYNANGALPGYGDGGPFARLLGEDPSPLSALLTAASFVVRA